MRSIVIVVFLEFCKLLFQIVCRPKQNVVEIFAPDTADQSFDERMRHRHVRHGLDLLSAESRLSSLITYQLFLADPTLALGLFRIPDQKHRHHQRHQNNPQDFAETEVDTDAKGIGHCHNHAK